MVSQERTVRFLGTSSDKEIKFDANSNRAFDSTGRRARNLAKICRTLADRGVNILAFQSQHLGRRSQIRLVVDDPKAAESVLDNEKLEYTAELVALVKLPHQPGELARAAAKLGEANININHAYCGVDAKTNEPLMIFGVSDAREAAKVLEGASAASA